MIHFLVVVFAVLAATYLFLHSLLFLTQDVREPPAIETGIPFIGPLIGMIVEKSAYYIRMRYVETPISPPLPNSVNLTAFNRDKHRLPIYTLRLPFSRIYVVNATELIPVVQKQWRTVSFGALAAGAGRFVGMSKEGVDLMHKDLTSDEGFTLSWPRLITSVMGPGTDLDNVNKKAVEVFAHEVSKFREKGMSRVGLWRWTRDAMVIATTEAVWGPQNPYRDTTVAEAWR
jgi:hypothetical protein